MSIQILSSEVINQIAAGEVVERPSHLLKELIENSIDATATRIEIYFSQGGRGVEVIDNGQGISEQDLAKSLDRFATSKISNSEDIWQLRTFGFRGEALASIASVSDLLISSRPAEQKQAYQLRSRFGQKSNLEKTGNLNGTRIKIDNLFENTPARLKFLKSDSAEASAIKNTLKALALSHPAVEFKIQENNDLIFYWPVASSRRQRVQQILEETELFTGQAERQGYHAEAIFSSPHKVFKTSKNIWLFVQNRWVQDRSLQAAVMEAYRNLLMHKEYPLAVVWLDVPLDQVDVNIHPTKSQVKFVDASLAFRAVQASIRDVLETAPWLQGSAGGPQFSAKDYSFSSGAGAANENHLADRSQSMVAGENF
ncbi:MAG: DNA mismatch repair endonuclease MutL [Pseudobdellovibrionaceae bacterium]